MSEVETVGLNLDGNFAAEAEKDAAGAEHLSASLGKLAGAAAKVKAPAWSGDDWLKVMEKGAERAAKRMDELRAASAKARGLGDGVTSSGPGGGIPTALKGPPPTFNAFQKLLGSINDVFGQKAAGGVAKGAISLSEAGAKLAPIAPALASSGAILFAAGAALAAASGALLGAGLKFSVEKSSEKEIQSAIFGKLGGSYDVALNLAAKFNLDEGKAVETVKTLLGAKLNGADIEVWTKILVGVGGVRGEGKAQALLEKIATTAAKGGKASEDSIKGFAEAGVDVDKVWAKLAAKLGVSIDKAKAKVKAGSVDMKDALDAVKGAASDDFGGIADAIGGSVPGLLNALRISFGQLFADVDMGPLKEMLGSLIDVMKGGPGAELKSAVTELFGNLGEALFGAFKGEEGKAKLSKFVKDVAAAVREAASAVKALTPTFRALEDVVMQLAGKAPGAISKIASTLETVQSVLGPIVGVFLEVRGVVSDVFGSIADLIMAPLGLVRDAWASFTGDAKTGGSAIGSNLVEGITTALFSGMGGAIGAIVGVIQGVIDAAHGAADAHSPSRKMQKLGGFMTEGLAVGQSENDNAARAAADTAQGAIDAAAGASGGAGAAGGKGGGAGGSGITVIVQVQGGALTGEQIQAVKDAAYEGALLAQRRMAREGREGSKAA